MSRAKGRRRGAAGTRDQVGAALAAWRAHTSGCYTCHSNAGHPGLYCDQGFQLAQAVTQARAVARAAAQARQRNQGALW